MSGVRQDGPRSIARYNCRPTASAGGGTDARASADGFPAADDIRQHGSKVRATTASRGVVFTVILERLGCAVGAASICCRDRGGAGHVGLRRVHDGRLANTGSGEQAQSGGRHSPKVGIAKVAKTGHDRNLIRRNSD